MIKALTKIAAALSAAVLCAVPMTNASAAYYYDDDDDHAVSFTDLRLFKERIGDANGDGQVDYSDSLTIQLAMSYPKKYTIASPMYADVNNDGLVNIFDANLISRYCLGCFDSFSIFFGDVDNDGWITKNDLEEIKYYLNQKWNTKTISSELFVRCDVDGNGVIDGEDRCIIRNVYKYMKYIY